MLIVKLLKWFLDVLENDGHDIREVKGKIHMAIALMEYETHYITSEGERRSYYKFGADEVVPFLIGEEVEEDA